MVEFAEEDISSRPREVETPAVVQRGRKTAVFVQCSSLCLKAVRLNKATIVVNPNAGIGDKARKARQRRLVTPVETTMSREA